jgi:predicted aldo/keto reductase-like oxidoreductase
MQYRTFGKLDWRPSALGFGAMRLPILDGDHGKIDEDLATRMIRSAIDGGVNYVDTAWPYHNGESESFIGRCLKEGYRGRVRLATKMPSWLIEKPSDFDHYLNEQLKRLQTDHIDFYLLHGLNATQWPKLRDFDVFSWAEAARNDGRIGHLGFSFHDDLAVFRQIVDSYDWTFCQIMYNYMDTGFQAGREGLFHAAAKGLAVVVMEPLRGGALSRPAPEAVARLWREAKTQRSQAEWALQWVWSHPEVSLLLSGMSEMSHVEENLRSAERARVHGLTEDEMDLVDRVRDTYRSLAPIPCTDCRYCMPCPQGVSIPRIFSMYNTLKMYDDLEGAKRSYNQFTKPENRADGCISCGQCEAACPQQIGIIEWLKTVHAALANATDPSAV